MFAKSSHRPRRLLGIKWVAAALACAAATPAPAQVKWVNHLDTSMINEIVYKDGVLYMATFGGLVLYDVARGEFEQFANIPRIPSNAMRCLAFDADDNLYIGTADFGVAKVRFSGGAPSLVRSLNSQIDGLSSNTVNAIAMWGDDIVYGANPGAGTIRNDFASARYFERDGLPDDDVKDVLADGDHAWLATNAGVAVLDRFGLIRRPTGAPTVANVLGTDGTTIWVGTNDGVWRFDPSDSSWTDVGPDTRQIYGLTWDGTTMWAGSTRNLCEYTGTGAVWNQFPMGSITANYVFPGGGGTNQARGLAVVENGDVYFGSVQPSEQRGANLIRFDGTTMTNLFADSPGGSDLRRFSFDVDGSLWCMFMNFYAGKLTTAGTWVNYNSAIPGIEVPSHPSANLAMLADTQGYKWFCSLPNVTLDQLDDRRDANYANDTWTRHPAGSGGGETLGSTRLQRAVEDPVGNRWFMSDVDGINILSRDGSEWFQMNPLKDARMLSGDVVDVAFGRNFAYIAYRTLGIQIWALDGFDWPTILDTAGDSWVTRVPSTVLPAAATVSAIELRSDNTLFIATEDGLFKYPSSNPSANPPRVVDEIPVYTGIGAGILSAKVRDVSLDHDENLWVATELGINKIARDDFADIQAYTTAAAYVASLADLRYPLSIITPLSNADCRALVMHPTKDILYIGTLSGLSVLDYTPAPSTTTDLSKVYLYPNPVYRSRGQNDIKIQNITGPVSVDVYNLEGVLVSSTSVDTNGQVAWDLTDASGFVVASGNYLVRVSGPGGAVTKTIAVLR